ncbi:hypothetical protein [Nocardia sp. NPDC006630]|uniref:hypothetical protein n=1 Tax=unclassified Nocardia TaxID=2637762 RepID=UPI00324CA281
MGVDPHHQAETDRMSARIAHILDWMNLEPLQWSLHTEPADECGLGILTEALGSVPADYDPVAAELLALQWAEALNLTERPALTGRREFSRYCDQSDNLPVDRLRIWCNSLPSQDL